MPWRLRHYELVETNFQRSGPEDVGVTHIVSRGVVEPTRHAELEATVVIYTEPLAFSMYAKWYRDGIRMITPATRRTPPQSLSPKAKISNKMNHMVADFEAKAIDPEALPLMLDYDGNVAESSGANFLFLRKDTIYIPNRRHVLGGITMDSVLEIAYGSRVQDGGGRLHALRRLQGRRSVYYHDSQPHIPRGVVERDQDRGGGAGARVPADHTGLERHCGD